MAGEFRQAQASGDPGAGARPGAAACGRRDRSRGATGRGASRARANGQPNNPALSSSSSGLVSGEATMKATIGAHGVRVASMPSTIAVVPHEQNGVSVASKTAAPMASQLTSSAVPSLGGHGQNLTQGIEGGWHDGPSRGPASRAHRAEPPWPATSGQYQEEDVRPRQAGVTRCKVKA